MYFYVFFHNKKQLILYLVIIVNIFLAILDSLSSPSYKSIIKELVYTNHIQNMNSVLETASRIIQVAGPIIALFIYNKVGMRGALLIDGVSFIISAFIISLLIPIVENKKEKKSIVTIHSVFKNIKEGIEYLYSKKTIFYLILFSSICNFLLAGYNLIIPFTNLMFSKFGQNIYGMILTVEALGGIIGALCSTHINKKLNEYFMSVFILLNGILLISLPLIYNHISKIEIILFIFGLFSFFLSNFNIQFFSLVQIEVESEYLGRVFSIIFTIAVLFMPLGSFAFSFLNPKSSFNFIILGSIMVFSSLLFFVLLNIHKKSLLIKSNTI